MTSQAETIVTCIHTDPILEGVACSVGRLKWKKAGRAPRVTWIPAGFTIQPTENGQRRRIGSHSNRVLAIRLQTFDVHVHGRDIEQLEFLIDAVITATRNQVKGAHIFGDGTIDSQTETGADYALDGEKAVLAITIQIPVFLLKKPGRPMVTPTKEGATVNFESELDGSLTEVCAWTEP